MTEKAVHAVIEGRVQAVGFRYWTAREAEALSLRGWVRNRRDGKVTHIGEGMTEWRCGDQVGYGLSEFLRQVR